MNNLHNAHVVGSFVLGRTRRYRRLPRSYAVSSEGATSHLATRGYEVVCYADPNDLLLREEEGAFCGHGFAQEVPGGADSRHLLDFLWHRYPERAPETDFLFEDPL